MVHDFITPTHPKFASQKFLLFFFHVFILQKINSVIHFQTSFQGTVLDRIDYNVEHAAVKVEEGAKQLKRAEHYQRKNRNMKCILILAGSIIVLIILLVIIKRG